MSPVIYRAVMQARVANIQALRGLAALAVVVCHAASRSGLDFEVGNAGVELFFVISGFVMVKALSNPDLFLLRRAARILPLYWIVVLTAFAAMTIAPGMSDVRPDFAGSMLLLPLSSDNRILAVSWTLTHEMLFYALLASLPRERAIPLATLAIVALVAAGFTAAPQSPLLQAATDPINLCFVAGMALANVPRGYAPTACIIAALAYFTAIQALSIPASESPARILWFGPAAAILVYGAVFSPLRFRALERLGETSYSLYLVHIPAMKGVAVAFAWLGLGYPNAFWLVAVSTLVGTGMFYVLEHPMIQFASNLAPPRIRVHQLHRLPDRHGAVDRIPQDEGRAVLYRESSLSR
ncbi:acyltransferase family protein [Allosphingosinicella flava]|uniref:acyltransferase family protein n=1 Tax=Allosphingosinicella flava TaxID=2771430 RepID=UPI001CF7DEDB|nr:acyltransferase [Sphingosinicella flava]